MISEEEEKRYLELQEMAMDFARQGESQSLEKMVEHGLSVNLSDTKGNTLLMIACYHDRIDTVKMLLRNMANTEKKNNRGQTPLSGAIFKGHFEIVKSLITDKASCEKIIGNGQSAIQLASLFGHQAIVELLKDNSPTQRVLGMKPEKLVVITSKIKKLIKLFF